MCLGELTWPDRLESHDYRKVSMRHSVEFLVGGVSFWLPGHKADKFFEGNRLIIHKSGMPDTCALFTTYLKSWDSHFPLWPELWLHANGAIPTCSWFIAWLQKFFPNCITGQSMCPGGAGFIL